MCLIVISKKEQVIPKAVFQDICTHNADGFGMMYLEGGRVQVEKHASSSNYKHLHRIYMRVRDKNPIMHFRMRTHGDVNKEMSHPYDCGYGVWMMHNGVMHNSQGDDKTKSDTWYFVKDVIAPLFKEVRNPGKFIQSVAFYNIMIDCAAGQRLVFLGPQGYAIMNDSLWYTPKTGRVAGLLTSNNYAWDCGEEPKKYDGRSFGNITYDVSKIWDEHDARVRSRQQHTLLTPYDEEYWKIPNPMVSQPNEVKDTTRQVTVVTPDKVTVYEPGESGRKTDAQTISAFRRVFGLPAPTPPIDVELGGD
jgi:hypothetical protein